MLKYILDPFNHTPLKYLNPIYWLKQIGNIKCPKCNHSGHLWTDNTASSVTDKTLRGRDLLGRFIIDSTSIKTYTIGERKNKDGSRDKRYNEKFGKTRAKLICPICNNRFYP